jgi:hypothetical protein
MFIQYTCNNINIYSEALMSSDSVSEDMQLVDLINRLASAADALEGNNQS